MRENTIYTKFMTPSDGTIELDEWISTIINTGVSTPAPFTTRLQAVFNHSCFRRLIDEHQLGLVREVYPSANHNRWSHSIGVLSGLIKYYRVLQADPDIPTLRIIITNSDIEHAMIAAMLHDIGQTSFAHDFEATNHEIFNHEYYIEKLLKDRYWGGKSLAEVIEVEWKDICLDRILLILNYKKKSNEYLNQRERIVDGLAADIINGPIDADKYDYINRDSIACGVPYGKGVDYQRFLQTLTTAVKNVNQKCRLSLAYKAKGSTAIESLLLARYQLYGSVYWHHTFRCLQSMFVLAVSRTFSSLTEKHKKIGNFTLNKKIMIDLYYHRVVCNKPWSFCINQIKNIKGIDSILVQVPPTVGYDRNLEFVWLFADGPTRDLIKSISKRENYKRLFEIRIAEITSSNYDEMKNKLNPDNRNSICEKIDDNIIKEIRKKIREKGTTESVPENDAIKALDNILSKKMIRFVLDFPIKGIPDEKNFPFVLSDSTRKYFNPYSEHKVSIFQTVKKMQTQIATLRVFVHCDFHELIIRYLDSHAVMECISNAIPIIKID